MSHNLVPDIPETMPRMGNAFVRGVGVFLLRLMGWRFKGEIPRESKLVVIAAPHTSNWDFVVGMAAIMAMGLKISFFMKKEAFVWPFKNLFFSLGGIPIDRGRSSNVIQQSVQAFDEQEKIWVAITPEGTRSKVTRWKSGFARIAHGASVPVFVVGFSGPTKEIVFDKLETVSDRFEEDTEALRQYSNDVFVGIRPENQ